jgi:hypothetical protein
MNKIKSIVCAGPAIAELAADGSWAQEFLAAENSAPRDAAAWETEFSALVRAPQSDTKWAAQFLDQADAHKWYDESLYRSLALQVR